MQDTLLSVFDTSRRLMVNLGIEEAARLPEPVLTAGPFYLCRGVDPKIFL